MTLNYIRVDKSTDRLIITVSCHVNMHLVGIWAWNKF